MIEQAVLIGLAAWRLTALLVYERGPFDVLLRARDLLGIRQGRRGNVLQELLGCVWCLSLWMAAALYGVWQVAPAVVVVIAAAAVVLVVERWCRGNSD